MFFYRIETSKVLKSSFGSKLLLGDFFAMCIFVNYIKCVLWSLSELFGVSLEQGVCSARIY